jgi:hypothetical protein
MVGQNDDGKGRQGRCIVSGVEEGKDSGSEMTWRWSSREQKDLND